jgi:hypothetical protein
MLETSVQELDRASASLVQAQEKINEGQAEKWQPFYQGRSLYAGWVEDLLHSAERHLQIASIWIEAHSTAAGSELCERLGSVRSQLHQLMGVLAEVEKRPEYVAAATQTEATVGRALAIASKRSGGA